MDILHIITELFQRKKTLKDSLLIGKIKNIYVRLFAIMLLVSCAEKVITPPENLIPKEKMTNILYDLALLNAAESTNPEALKGNSIEMMPYLFEKYAIDSVQFSESDLYYASVPLEYEDIYKTLQARLEDKVAVLDEERKQKTEQARKKAARVRDSLKNVSGESKTQKTPTPVLSEKKSNGSK